MNNILMDDWLRLISCRERNIPEYVKKISPRFQDGLKAFSDSPIIGEVTKSHIYYIPFYWQDILESIEQIKFVVFYR